jgi:thioredoxin reductase (NADPH)
MTLDKKYTVLLILGALFIISFGFFKNYFGKVSSHQDRWQQVEAVEQLMPVVIIGSGPAGLAAGVYTARAGLQTLVIEGPKPGGLLTETSYIENWPGEPRVLGRDLMARFKQQNQDLGVQFITDLVERVDFNVWPYQIYLSGGEQINALSVILATGASPRTLGLANEQKYWGKGVSSCAVCDAPFFKNKNVVVVGGGDSAMEQILQLAPHVKQVTLLVRKDVLRASQAMQDKVAQISNAKIMFNTQIIEILDNDQEVIGVKILDNQTNVVQEMAIDGIFLAIGHDPVSKIFKGQVAMDQQNYVLLQPNSQATSKLGVFAAGEVVDHTYRQAGVASGDGIKAALETIGFLQNIGFNNDLAQKLKGQFFQVNQQAKVLVAQIKSFAEFNDLVANNKLPFVLDFYTDYCAACLHMLPYYQATANLLGEKMNFFKVDADEVPDLVRHLQIKRVPTFAIFKDGQMVDKVQDVLTKSQMVDLLQKYLE